LYAISQDKENMVKDLADRGKSGVEDVMPEIFVSVGRRLNGRSP